MKTYVTLATALICFSLTVQMGAQISQSNLEAVITIENLEHPYLLFDAEDKREILSRIKSSQRLSELYEKQLLLAQRDLVLQIETDLCLPLENSRLYEKDQARSLLRSYADKAARLAFMYQMTGEKAYAEKAFEYAHMVCKQDTWVSTAHEFDNIYRRVWPWNVKDDQVVFSYDLSSAATATLLSLTYDWLYPALDKSQRDRIRGALLENAVTRVRGNYEYHWWATAYRCNWSGVCHSGVGLTGLALIKEDPHLLDVVAASYNGVELMLNELGVDGGWQEGRGYWRKATSESFLFMDAIKRLSLGEFNLFHSPRLYANPVEFPLYTMYANFEDGKAGPTGEPWFINKLVAETKNPSAAFYLERFIEPYEWEESYLELIWPKPDVTAIEPKEKSRLFRSIGWATLQSDFTSDSAFSITCKAGTNDDPHHGHLDNGHFILSYKGNNFIKDFGRPSYDDYYFAANRWDYVLASTRGHNVIMVNQEEQEMAKYKDQAWQEGVGGEISSFLVKDSSVYLSMDLTGAYPEKELKFWQRQILLEKPTLAIILDKVQAEKGSQIRSRIHPGGQVIVKNDYYLIKDSHEQLAVIPILNQAYQILQGNDMSMSLNINSRPEPIPYVDVFTEAKMGNTLLGMLVLPVESGIDPQEIFNSIQMEEGPNGEITLSLKISNRKLRYTMPISSSY